MSELWEVCGPSWRLPIRIEWHDSLGIIKSDDCQLLTCQHVARHEVLKPFVFERSQVNWICRADLQKVAHISEKKTAEDVVEWLPVREKVDVPKFQDNEFIQAYCSSEFAVMRDPAVMDLIWISFCKFGLHWLVNEEKEIDFLFARVIPLFLRKNWSNAAAKFEREEYSAKRILRGDFLSPDIESMCARGVADYLASSRVTSYCEKERLARPLLEVIESPAYVAAAMKRERARRRKWGVTYWTMFLERLKRQLPTVLEVYAHHLKEAAHQLCKVTENVRVSSSGKRIRAAHSCSPDEASKHWMEGDAVSVSSEQTGDTGAVPSSDEALRGMSDLQSGAGDVRDAGCDLPQSENWTP